MRRFLLLLLFACLAGSSVWSQKMLLIERANQARTTKLYIGDRLIFRLEGEEDYWYERTITDILPESNSLLLDNYLVRVEDISAIKVQRKTIWRIIGGTLFSFGVSLGIATGAAALYRDDDENYPLLIGGTVASVVTGRWMLKRKKLKLGDKHRLRIIEIRFDPPKA